MTGETDLYLIEHRRLPLELWSDSREWLEGLVREFDIIAAGADEGLVRDLLDFVASGSERFSRFVAASNRRLDEAARQGLTEVDVEVSLPHEAGKSAQELWHLIEAADEYCRQGALMTLALSDRMRRYLNWYLTEVARQIEGDDPHPWSDRVS